MTSFKLNTSKVTKAVSALRQISSKSKDSNELLDKIEDVEIQICVKRIPQSDKTIKLKLPHSIKKPDVEVCLFVKDLDRKEREYDATVQHFQDILKKKGVKSITEVVPLKSLKTEYKPFEAKRNLSNAFDIFLSDARITRLLPSYLGKHFYGKKKAPIQVNLQAKDLSSEIESALCNSRCQIGNKGSSSAAVVGNLLMGDEEITQNVVASANEIADKIPGGAVNIKLLSLKLKESTSIPIFLGAGGPQEVTLPKKAAPEEIEAEDVSTVFGAKVKVFPNGRIVLVKDGDEQDDKKTKRSQSKSRGKPTKRKGAPVKQTNVKRVAKNRAKRTQKK